MSVSSLPLVRWRLAQLASHLVVALIALVVVGGATRVMEAGLACPDWPLCFGSFLPGRQMNLQVFLEWFHRLDAFLIGIAFFVQLAVAVVFKTQLPKRLIWIYGFMLFLVGVQGALGALTVLKLLPSMIVTAHLILALTLVALMSAVAQELLQCDDSSPPRGWRVMGLSSLFMVLGQCIIGGRMSTTWSSQICLSQGEKCQLLDLHRISAMPVALVLLTFVVTSIGVGGWSRTQWPLLLIVVFMLAIQVLLGITSVHTGLSEPVVTVGHQLVAAILVALLAALSSRRPDALDPKVSEIVNESLFEACHG